MFFGTYHARVAKAEVSFTLLKSDSTKDTLPAILKILGTNKGKTCGEISFW